MKLNNTKPVPSDNLSHAPLWEAFWRNEDRALENLLEAYLPLTRRVLERISIRLPSHVAVQDLSQVALVGLYKALTNFKPYLSVPFEAYAYPRIRGAVIDELRAGDFLSRGRRARLHDVERVINEWMIEHGEMPDEEDICSELDMSSIEFNCLMDQAKPWCSLDADDEDHESLYDTLADIGQIQSSSAVQRKDMQVLLREGFRALDMREQKILYLYYFEELRLSEIAELYGLTESRISQIRALSVLKLRAALECFPREDLEMTAPVPV